MGGGALGDGVVVVTEAFGCVFSCTVDVGVLGTNAVFEVVENADVSDDGVNVVVSSFVVGLMVLVAGMLVISLDVKASVLNTVEAKMSSTVVAAALMCTVVNIVVISAVASCNDVGCAVDSDKVKSLVVVWFVVEVLVLESSVEVGSIIISGFVVLTVVVPTANAAEAKCEVEYHVVVVPIADWVLLSVVGNNAVGK